MLTNRQFSGAIQIKWKKKWLSIVNTHNSRIAVYDTISSSSTDSVSCL